MNKRPTIAELEEILNNPDGRQIEITPDGEVREIGSDPDAAVDEITQLRQRLAEVERERDALRDALQELIEVVDRSHEGRLHRARAALSARTGEEKEEARNG